MWSKLATLFNLDSPHSTKKKGQEKVKEVKNILEYSVRCSNDHAHGVVHFQVVRLASDTFNYTAFDRAKARSKKFATERFPDTLGKHVKAGLPPKVCQLWLHCLHSLESVIPANKNSMKKMF